MPLEVYERNRRISRPFAYGGGASGHFWSSILLLQVLRASPPVRNARGPVAATSRVKMSNPGPESFFCHFRWAPPGSRVAAPAIGANLKGQGGAGGTRTTHDQATT